MLHLFIINNIKIWFIKKYEIIKVIFQFNINLIYINSNIIIPIIEGLYS